MRVFLAAAAIVGLTLALPGSALTERGVNGGRVVPTGSSLPRRPRSVSAPTHVHEALALACATYGHCAWLQRVAWCESRFDVYARNRSGATGLFQFMPSTFRATPYGAADIYSPYAQALAAGWMASRGYSGQWVCR